MILKKGSFNVVSLGDLVLDVLIEGVALPVEINRHQRTGSVKVEPGGAGNFLITGSRLGLNTTPLAVIGDDLFGHQLVEILNAEQINTNLLAIHEQEQTAIVFDLKDQHDRYVFLGSLATGQSVHWNSLWDDAIRTCDAVQLWGYSLLEERMSDVVREGLACAKRHGRPVFFDPGPLASQIKPTLLKQVLRQCAVLVLNQEEVPLITGENEPDSVKKFLMEGVDTICVKRGGQGCIIYQLDSCVSHAGFQVEVVDSAGAGDSFNAGLMTGWLQGWSLDEMAVFSNAVGAAKVRKNGTGRQMPRLHEILALLSENQIELPVIE